MAYLALACGVTFVALAVFVAAGAGAGGHASGWTARAAWRRVRGACLALGSTYAATLLAQTPSWARACDALARRLRAHGVYPGRAEACGMLLGALAAGSAALALLARSPLGALVGLVAGFAAVPLWHSSRCRERERALIDEMPEVFRTLAMALGSGETLTQAIEYVGLHERGYAGEAFVHAALRLRCGDTTERAMAELARELDAPGVGLLTTALVIAQRTGSPLRSLFQSSARLVERQGEYERMLAVKTAQVRLSVRIVCLLPLGLVGLLSLISVDFQQGVSTLPGTLSVLVAAAMDGCALLIIRRLMRGVL